MAGPTPVSHGYRCRDLIAGVVVLAIGATMVDLALSPGDGESVGHAARTFGVGTAALLLAHAFGALADRLGRRYPALVVPRHSPLPGVFVATTIAGGVILACVEGRHVIARLVSGLMG